MCQGSYRSRASISAVTSWKYVPCFWFSLVLPFWELFFLPLSGILSPLLSLWLQSHKETVFSAISYYSLSLKKKILLVYLKRLKQVWILMTCVVCLSSSISELDGSFYNSLLARSSRELHCLRRCQESALQFQESVVCFPFVPKLILFAGLVHCPLWTTSEAFKRRRKFLPVSVIYIGEGLRYFVFLYILEWEGKWSLSLMHAVLAGKVFCLFSRSNKFCIDIWLKVRERRMNF